MCLAVCIVGKSSAGKTTIMEQLVRELKERGYKVAAVKHAPKEIAIDMPGKDSWRFAQAGSEAVLASSANKIAFVENTDRDYNVDEILRILGSRFDVVLMEGFKKGRAPKIEVHRKELGEELVCPAAVLSAVISDEPLAVDVPLFSFNDIKNIADFIEKNFLFQPERDVFLFINGKQIHMLPFVKDIIARVVLAIVSTLKGVGKVKGLDLSIRSGRDLIPAMHSGNEQEESSRERSQNGTVG
ncbi:MAG: molybdopterin-guanine dinucleotide biosynthesis protein B [Chloroflexota bacterium]|nr:molybdopterin-guanine dinucleotide biosynthesis protein B [Chloroflexota bacterium]